MNMTTQSMNGLSGYSLGAGDYYVFNNIFFRGSYSNFFNMWIYDPINSWPSYANQRPRWGRVRIINNTFMAGHHGMINTGRDFYMVIWNNLMWGLGTYSGSSFGRTAFIQNDEISSANFNIRNNRFYTFLPSGINYLRDSSLAVMHPSNAFYANSRPNLVNVPQPAITNYTYSTFPYSLNPLDYGLTSSATNEIGQARVLTEADLPMNNLAPSWFKVWDYIQKDFRGVTRGSIWDVGAIEYFDGSGQGDITSPEIVQASLIDSVTLAITFSEQLNQQTALNINNYNIDNGINVLGAVLNNSTVRLTTSAHSPGFYSVTVNNVTDLAGNVISPQNNSAIYGYNPDPITQLLKFVPGRSNASSVPEPEHRPEKTFDGLGYNSGDPTSRWAGQYLPQWIGYDLNDVRMLSKVRIQFYNWQNGRIYNYSIQTSTDSVNWTNVKSNVNSAIAEWTEETFDPIPARYVRIVVHSNNQNEWASLWETEFYGQLIISNNEDQNNIPSNFLVNQNYPNPFNPNTKISWQTPVSSRQTLKIYDILGNEVATLVDEYKEAGKYEIEFNASNLPSGIYIYRFQSEAYSESKKMILLK
jgi:hypothetical protein